MKQNIRSGLFFLLITAWAIASCSGKKESMEHEGDWAEMDAYHMIMAESFHPLKDSSNLAPAKANAERMAAEAEKWAAADLPEKVSGDEMKAMIASLKASSRAFADQVEAGVADEELGIALTKLHTEFHHIMEAWEGGHQHH